MCIRRKEGCANMKIQAVLIDGFKNLSNVKIKLDNITALVALNNFGKSNVLSGIDFGLGFIKATEEEKKDMMANSDFIPENINAIGRNYKFEMEALTVMNKIEYRMLFAYEFVWEFSDRSEPHIVSEVLKIKREGKGNKYQQLINRNSHNAVYKSSETGRCSSKINVEPTEFVLNKLRAYDELFYATIIKKFHTIRFYMENNLDAKKFYKPDPIIRKGLEGINIDASNLPRVIYQLKESYPDKFELLKDIYMNLFPNVKDIIVKQYSFSGKELPEDVPFVMANSIYVLYVADKNILSPVPFEVMSDGAKRVFMILTKIILANVANIALIAIEEPENCVHPSLFRDFIQVICQLLDDCKVIITSHSPYIISYLEPSWIHVGINKQPGIATFFAFKKSGEKLLQKDAAEFKMSTGDYLFSMMADEGSSWEDYLECE